MIMNTMTPQVRIQITGKRRECDRGISRTPIQPAGGVTLQRDQRLAYARSGRITAVISTLARKVFYPVNHVLMLLNWTEPRRTLDAIDGFD